MKGKKFTDEEYLQLYRKGLNDTEAAEELSVTPSAVSRRRRELDLEPKIPQREWSRKKVVEEIKKFAEEHERPPKSYEVSGLRYAAGEYIGSFTEALKEAGFEPWKKVGGWTEKEVVEGLKNLADKVGRSPSMEEARAEGRTDLIGGALSNFGSWNAAKEAAGLETHSGGRGEEVLTCPEVLKAIEERGPSTLNELFEGFDAARSTVETRVRRLEEKGEVHSYRCNMKRGSGCAGYRDQDFFVPGFRGKKIVYLDGVAFADFLAEEVLKFDVHEDIDQGLKHALTSHMKGRLPGKAIERLREKYTKGK